MSRQRPLRLLYNNILNVDKKTYLPLVGNSIPHKQIATFDGGDTLTFTQTGGTATGGYDNVKSYHGKACYKVSLAANSSATVELDFNNPIDLTSLGRKQNNYAQINQTGKYGNLQDQLFLVLNALWNEGNSGSQEDIILYNGTKTATTKISYTEHLNLAHKNQFIKMQFGLNSTYFNYSNGFSDSDFLNITEIQIVLSTSGTSSIIYIQDLFVALPKTNSDLFEVSTNPTIIGAYYPAVMESNAIFVSQLFGNDTNTGTTKQINSTSGPVKTIETAVPLALAGALPYICLLDSATYKPVALDGSYVGIQQGLTNNVTIIADYLETPVISAKPGLFDLNRVGTRTTQRTAFYENTAATGNILTVGVGGTYNTIGSAYVNAVSGDCITIIDSRTYDENLTNTLPALTIQAAAGQTPTWKCTAGNTCLDCESYNVNVFGIIFQGKSGTAETILKFSTVNNKNIQDCTFTTIGASSGASSAISIYGTGTATQIINNCIFSNNGEYFTAINHNSGASGNVKITNCIGYMGTTQNNKFIADGKANTNVLNIIAVGNQSLSSYVSKITPAYFYFCGDITHSTGSTNFSGLLNDTNEAVQCLADWIVSPDYNIITNTTLLFNYFHDVVISLEANSMDYQDYSLINTRNAVWAGSAIVANNYFNNITWTAANPSTGGIIKCVSSGAGFTINNNIFNNCNCAACIIMDYAGTVSGNIFNNSNSGYKIYNVACIINNSIFNNCGSSISAGTSGAHLTVNNIITWNSPITYPSNQINYNMFTDQNPGFIDPDNGNFGWYYDSPLETLHEGLTAAIQNWALSSPIIQPFGANLNFNFIDIEGFYNTCMLSSVSSAVTATYCNINNSLIGKYNVNGLVNLYNCFMTGNGIAVRENNVNIISQSTNKNNIIDTNGTGIMLMSGSDIEHNTIINNNYGISNIFTGYYNQSSYMSQYVTLKNNIVARNAAWDYVGTIQSDYSIMPNRYYDSLPTTNTAYVNTVGEHDQSGQPEIDAPAYFNQNLYDINSFTYFPDTIFEGYMSNSPAWMTASDTWINGQGQTVGKNIGARDIPALTSALDFAEYDFNYVGTVDNKDEFYALENPRTIEYSVKPINNDSMRFITGEYENSPTAYTPEILLKWTTPGAESKILDTGRAAFEGAFQSIWVVALSFDFGTTYIYYKVDKDAAMTMSQQSFIFNDTGTVPYGNYQLHLIQQPANFIITDFLTNMLGE